MGQAQNLATGRDGPGQPKSGTGRAGTAKIRDGMRDKTGQSRKGRPKTGKGCSKTEGHSDKNFFLFWDKGTTGRPVPVCPGTSRGNPSAD